MSLFSGIEAASVAWGPLGWEPVAFSEIEPFPCELLATRFPQVPNLGDVSKIDWSHIGSVDLIVGGSPCQAFSYAGKRKGLLDERSALMLEYIRAVREVQPEWVLWENVPGVLSQSNGDAFETLQRELEDCGYSLSWRVLDAQFYGVAQRRRRVFLVGHARAGCAAAVLLEPESLRWDFATSKAKRESLTRDVKSGTGNCLPFDTTQITSPANGNNPQWGDPCHPLAATAHAPTIITYPIAGNIIGRSDKNGGHQFGVGSDIDPMFTLDTVAGHAVVCMNDDSTSYTHNTIDHHVYAFQQNQRDEVRLVGGDGQVCGALTANFGMKNTNYIYTTSNGKDYVGTLCARDYKGIGNQDIGEGKLLADGHIVRRLTPLECERLQGFPDGWTDIYEETPDTPRYKALGNSMAVPVMRWIGERIQEVGNYT